MKTKRFVFKVVVLALLLCCIVWLNSFAIGNDAVKGIVQSFGYPGIFFISVLSGFNLAIPIPAIGFYPLFMALGFSSVMTIATISLGMVFGDGIGYLIGNAGRDALDTPRGKKIATFLHSLQQKHRLLPYILVLIYAAVIPLPNELLVIPMAFAGYRFLPMAGMLFIGNIIFNILGAFGIVSITSLIS